MHYMHVLCMITTIFEKRFGNSVTYNYFIFTYVKKSVKIPNGQSESVNRRKTDNTNGQKKKDKKKNNDLQIITHMQYVIPIQRTLMLFNSNFQSTNILQLLLLSNSKIQILLYKTCTYVMSMKGHRSNIFPNSNRRKDQIPVFSPGKLTFANVIHLNE